MIHYLDLDKEYKDIFDFARFFDYRSNKFDVLTSYFIRELKKLRSKGNFTVTFEEEKPELIAEKIYGSTQFDWVIMVYNKLTNIYQIKSGLELNYPSLSDIENLYVNLISKETTSIQQENNNINQVINLDSNFSSGSSSGSSSSSSSGDLHFVLDFVNQDQIIVNHEMNKRPVTRVYIFDDDGNEVEIECSISFPQGLETKRVIVNLSEQLTGKVVLN